MALIVQKFGGSSVANAERVNNVADIVAKTYNDGNDVVVVVSAQGDTTDDLLAKAKEINPKGSKRELDQLLCAGEEISIALLAMALQARRIPAISLLGWQAGFYASSAYTSARIHKVDTERVRSELDKNKVVVVAGFQGINKYDDVTTFGRGGSDTSAVALAASLNADRCQFWKDVRGIYTTDPRKVKGARKLNEITYDEMLELAVLGAQVLNNRSVEMAKKYRVQLEVRSSLEPEIPGTIVKEVAKVEKMLIRGVTKDSHTARISVLRLPDEPGVAFQLFQALAAKHINVDIILQSVGRDNTKDITFTVTDTEAELAKEAVLETFENIDDSNIKIATDVTKVSIVGAGMESHPGTAARMFEALYSAGINISMISTSEIKISVLVKTKDADRAVEAVHDAFFPVAK
ncbi:MAG: aspartate kinase [Acutalibacteraceae bacterium]|jgi:aspartate kinase|nr:aspartate kinase [Acutalibacteraceae bacterium]